MVEHRLIERMIGVVERGLAQAEASGSIDPLFVDAAVDFIRMYADRTHHGKEEDILFRGSKEKSLSEQDERVMDELIEEHVFGRQTTKVLVEANDRYRRGDASALKDVTSSLGVLAEFYPTHIEKEDKVFFPAVRAYFSDDEEQAMLAEFWEFDRRMIHVKYEAVVEDLEGR
jgi:hemerythrin-like domain-containing protein